jgi:hypothetical protein
MEELITRYLELYKDMETSGKPEKMKIFGNAAKWAFAKMVDVSVEDARCWLDKLEAMYWHNYLSKDEATKIVGQFVNADGTKGAHWDYDAFKNAVESLGGGMKEEPYYNCYALWATANMLYSDHYNSVKEYVPKEDMPKFFYTMAVEKLKDTDRPRFVREYFKV